MKHLYYVSQSDFDRILRLNLSAIQKTRIFATLARINTLYMIAKAGSGHIGSSFSSMDIFSWLHLNTLTEEDVFFSSKGHDAPGLYSVLLGLGKLEFDNLHLLRRLNGLPGHPDVSTPCMVTNTGSLGMGVSKAKGMVFANQLDNKKGRVYVLTGDGELQEGQFWESLPGAVNNKVDNITVIIDHNKIQSDTWLENVNNFGDLEAKLTSYGWHVQRCNGNRLEDIEKAINVAKEIKGKPQIIIADTIKGCGVSFMEPAVAMSEGEEFYKFHSGAPSPENYEKAAQELIEKANALLNEAKVEPLVIETVDRDVAPVVSENIQKLIPAYEAALSKVGEKNNEVVVLDADLMIDCGLLSFRNNYPERFIECGIAEQDMVSQAGALALKGKIPIAHSFACFLAPRANEQIFNNASEKTKCIYVGSLAGLLPAGPGHSHQMVRDISALGGVPGLTMMEPCCEREVEMVLNYAVDENPASTYIRLVSIPYEIPFNLPDIYTLEKGKGLIIREGEDAILFSYGSVMLSEAYKAAEILEENGFGLKIVNLPWLNYVDNKWLKSVVGDTRVVYTLDNHLLIGGQGAMIGNAIAGIGLVDDIDLTQLGINDIPECGQNAEILELYRLDAKSLAERIKAG